MPPLQMHQGKPPASTNQMVNKSQGQISGLPPTNKRTNTGAPPAYLTTTRTAADSQHQATIGKRSRSMQNGNQPSYSSVQPNTAVYKFGNQMQTPLSQYHRNENMPQQQSVYQTVEPRMVNNFVSQKSPRTHYANGPAFNSMQTVPSGHGPTNQQRERSPVSS